MKATLVLWIGVLFYNPAFSTAEFQQFDEAYRHRRDVNSFRTALEGYRKIGRQDPTNAGAGWRTAMACSFLGLRVEADEDKIGEAYAEGKEAAHQALRQDPLCVPCHFWRAVNQVLHAKTIGVLKMLFSLKEIREHLKFVADHAPDYHHGAALRFLALIDWKLPGFLGGDNERAKEYFVLALKHGPDEAMNYQTYFEFLQDQGSDETVALEVLRNGAELSLPPVERIESTDALLLLREWWRVRREKHNVL